MTAALGGVFKHYASKDEDRPRVLDRRAIGAAISCATNTVCQQDDPRVQQILSRFGADADTLDLAGFLEYWKSASAF